MKTTILLAVALLANLPIHAQIRAYDVVIVGGGAGGTSAAIQAARLGARVALVEETDWLGGQMSAAGVSSMDEGGPLERDSGLYAELLTRLKAHYQKLGKSMGTCYYGPHHDCAEPSVVQNALKAMIQDARSSKHVLDVYMRTRIVKVNSTGDTVTGAITDKGLIFASHVLVDATEWGDIIPMTPAAYRLGNSTNTNPNPKACVQDLTWVAIIKKYPKGVPADLVMKNPPPGYTSEVAAQFAAKLKPSPNPPSTEIHHGQMQPPLSFPDHNSYRGLPDSTNPENYDASMPSYTITKTEINWFNDVPMNAGELSGQPRADMLCRATLKTLQNLYFIQHDLHETQWSVANDEGYDTPYNRANTCANIPSEFKALERNMPQMAYVRESYRLIGVHTLTGVEIRRVGKPPRAASTFKSSIATNDYGEDLHGCYAERTLEADLEHETDRPLHDHPPGPFQVPMESLIPMKVDGLLAAEKNISQSRYSNGSTRLQPIVMLTGQAVGVLSAIASRDHIQPRAVPVVQVQRVLLSAGSTLALDDLSDLQHGSELWQAAQFALVQGWLNAEDGRFLPERPLSVVEANDLLAKAYPNAPVSASDLSRTGAFRNAVEKLAGKASLAPRKKDDTTLTRAAAVQILYAHVQ